MNTRRKLLALLFLTTVLAGSSALALAAGEAVKKETDNSATLLLVAGMLINGLSSLGAAGILVKKYMNRVDKDGEAIPQLTATLQACETAIKAHTDSLKELYGSRNSHQDDLTQIKTTHRIRGCDKL